MTKQNTLEQTSVLQRIIHTGSAGVARGWRLLAQDIDRIVQGSAQFQIDTSIPTPLIRTNDLKGTGNNLESKPQQPSLRKGEREELHPQNTAEMDNSAMSPSLEDALLMATDKQNLYNGDLITSINNMVPQQVLSPIETETAKEELTSVKPQLSLDSLDNQNTTKRSEKDLNSRTISQEDTSSKAIDNEFIKDDSGGSLDRQFQEYVNRESFVRPTIATQACVQSISQFHPMILVTQIADRMSKMRKRTHHQLNKKRPTEGHLNRNEWSVEAIKLKEARRKKKALQNQLTQLNTQIECLQNPERSPTEPKMKQMIRISDNSEANINAISFVRKMNNERKLKQERDKSFWVRRDEQLFTNLQDIEGVGDHYAQQRRLRKAQEIQERIREYEYKRDQERKLRKQNLSFVNRIKKPTDMPTPSLNRKKTQLKRVRNLSECTPQSIIERYNRELMFK